MRFRSRIAIGLSTSLLIGITAWGDGPLGKEIEALHRTRQEVRYDVANQVFLLKFKEEDLRSRLRAAEERVGDLRTQLEKVAEDLEQARRILKGGKSGSRLLIGR